MTVVADDSNPNISALTGRNSSSNDITVTPVVVEDHIAIVTIYPVRYNISDGAVDDSDSDTDSIVRLPSSLVVRELRFRLPAYLAHYLASRWLRQHVY